MFAIIAPLPPNIPPLPPNICLSSPSKILQAKFSTGKCPDTWFSVRMTLEISVKHALYHMKSNSLKMSFQQKSFTLCLHIFNFHYKFFDHNCVHKWSNNLGDVNVFEIRCLFLCGEPKVHNKFNILFSVLCCIFLLFDFHSIRHHKCFLLIYLTQALSMFILYLQTHTSFL